MKRLLFVFFVIFIACEAPNTPDDSNGTGFIFNIVIDGVEEALWSQTQKFNEPDADAKESGDYWEITSLFVTNDAKYLYLGIGVSNLLVTAGVNYAVLLDIDNEPGSGDIGLIFGKPNIVYHASGTNHVVDFTIQWDLSSTPDLKKWNSGVQAWNAVSSEGLYFAQGLKFLELKVPLDNIGIGDGDQIYIRVISFNDTLTDPAFDVAPVDDTGSYNEAQLSTSTELWNTNNSSGMYQIHK